MAAYKVYIALEWNFVLVHVLIQSVTYNNSVIVSEVNLMKICS